MNYDPVNHPKHYVEQSAKIEPIDILRFAPFDLGNALKYMIRAGHKDNELQDLKKAKWYLDCAIDSASATVVDCPYQDFFYHYFPILQRFGFLTYDDFGFNAVTYISHLKEDVELRINKLINLQGIKNAH